MKRKTTKAPTERPGWTYCRDCLYWRSWLDPDAVLATDTGADASCYRHAADVVKDETGCKGGNGCGDGVPR